MRRPVDKTGAVYRFFIAGPIRVRFKQASTFQAFYRSRGTPPHSGLWKRAEPPFTSVRLSAESQPNGLPSPDYWKMLGQTACKPGSVPFRGMAIPLGRPLLDASRDRPGRRRGNPRAGCPACRPYLVLLPVGFAMPLALPLARWALTPPFHPYLTGDPPKRGQPGGLLSVALSLGSPPPAVSRHRVSVEPGLSSPLAERSHPAV